LKTYINKSVENFFTLLIYSIPIVFILGNLFTNTLVVLICLSIFFIKKTYIKDFKKHIYIFLILFLLFIFSSVQSNYIDYSLYKSLSYLRFLIFLFLIPILMSVLKINHKKLGITFLLVAFFCVLDSLVQLYFGKDLFGFPDNLNYQRLSGPFGDELIVGNFVLYFGFIGFFLILKNIRVSNLYLFIGFTIIGLFCFISGERNTFLSYLLFMFLLFLLSNYKKLIFSSLISVLIISIILFFNLERFNTKYNISSIQGAHNEIENTKQKDNNKINDHYIKKVKFKIIKSVWFSHYKAGLIIFDKNKIFGSGFKTFRYECIDLIKKKQNINSNLVCTTHPHNMYIELLSDTGLIGFFFLVFVFVLYIYKLILLNIGSKNFPNSIIISLFITFIFPLKPHGSIFSTSTAFLLWFIFSIILYENFTKKNNV